jgi:hypothetical protein
LKILSLFNLGLAMNLTYAQGRSSSRAIFRQKNHHEIVLVAKICGTTVWGLLPGL